MTHEKQASHVDDGSKGTVATTIEIHLPSFKAAALSTISKTDGRPVLESVAIVLGVGRVGYMATESHVLAMVVPHDDHAPASLSDGALVDWFKANADPEKLLLVPGELVAKIVKWKAPKNLSKSTSEHMTVTFEEKQVIAKNLWDGVTISAPKVYGDYPRVSALLPSDVTKVEATTFTPKYLTMIAKAAETLGVGSVVFFGGQSCLTPQFFSSRGDDASAVWLMMPCRPTGGVAPSWKPETKAQVAA